MLCAFWLAHGDFAVRRLILPALWHPSGVYLRPRIRYDLDPPDQSIEIRTKRGRMTINFRHKYSSVTVWQAEKNDDTVYCWRGVVWGTAKFDHVYQVPLKDRALWEKMIRDYKIIEKNSGAIAVTKQKMWDGMALKKMTMSPVR